MTEEKGNRPKGFYWGLHQASGEWAVFHWDGEEWTASGNEEPFTDHSFMMLGARIEPPQAGPEKPADIPADAWRFAEVMGSKMFGRGGDGLIKWPTDTPIGAHPKEVAARTLMAQKEECRSRARKAIFALPERYRPSADLCDEAITNAIRDMAP